MKLRLGVFAGVCVSFAFLSGCTDSKTITAKTAEASSGQGVAQSNDSRSAPNPLRNAYFGDLHLHTSYSMDAFAFGTRTTPEDSFRYAMGEPVEYFGKQWKRLAPLDFLAVTDHAEYLGVVRETINPNGPFAKQPVVHRYDQLRPEGQRRSISKAARLHHGEQANR